MKYGVTFIFCILDPSVYQQFGDFQNVHIVEEGKLKERT